jgi:hypothetical protein
MEKSKQTDDKTQPAAFDLRSLLTRYKPIHDNTFDDLLAKLNQIK